MAKLRALKASRRVVITRSFSYKLNRGNYESADFFCSQRAECFEADAEETSRKVYAFCKGQVLRDVNEFIEENRPLTSEEIRAKKDELQTALRAPRKEVA